VFAVRYFHTYIMGCEVILITDHNSLTFLMKQADPIPRLQRWILSLDQYRIMWMYRKGAANQVADALSRRYQSAEESEQAQSELIRLDTIICRTGGPEFKWVHINWSTAIGRRSIGRWVNWSTGQLVDGSIGRWTIGRWSIGRRVNWSMGQLVDGQLVDGSIGRWINWSMVNWSTGQLVDGSMGRWSIGRRVNWS
ncbi:MAG: hypothetical protein GY820_25660, partial [Gammaproteobacteria bacterium]|nr:hypothetical protein [Gammaproteobacteria bacterium]